MVKKTDVAVEDIVKQYAAGEFPGGETVNYGLAQNGVGLTDFTYTKDAIGQETIDKISDLEKKIIDGSLEVWNVVDQGYPSYYSGK